MSEKDFKAFLESLTYEELSNVVWHRLVDGSIPGFGNLTLQRDGFYASDILDSLYGSKSETPLAIQVKKICGEHIKKITELPTGKMFDGKKVAGEIVAIHEFSFLSASLYSAAAIEPLTVLYGRDFSILPQRLQTDTLGYIAQGLAQILLWHSYLATDRHRIILESEMWKARKGYEEEGYHVGYFEDLVFIFPTYREELISKLRSNNLAVDEARLNKWINSINPKLRKRHIKPNELKELGFSDTEIQVAVETEKLRFPE